MAKNLIIFPQIKTLDIPANEAFSSLFVPHFFIDHRYNFEPPRTSTVTWINKQILKAITYKFFVISHVDRLPAVNTPLEYTYKCVSALREKIKITIVSGKKAPEKLKYKYNRKEFPPVQLIVLCFFCVSSHYVIFTYIYQCVHYILYMYIRYIGNYSRS